jgi:drug/metabolite transporter (DMT)-like permease
MTPYAAGILLALAVAGCWTLSSIAFSAAGRRVGSVPVNLIRLAIALAMLTLAARLSPRGLALPTDATAHQATWLALSGVVGFFLGDLALFRAYVLIGPRRASLVMSLAPAFAAVVAFAAIGERLSVAQTLGVAVTLAGVVWVVAERGPAPPQPSPMTSPDLPADAHDPHAPDAAAARASPIGLVLALLGAAGQGAGAVMTKHAYEVDRFDAIASTQLRAAAAVPLFLLFVVATGRTRDTLAALCDRRAMWLMMLGAVAGPVAGVSLFNASIARVPSGVTSTLAGLVPIFVLPVAAVVQHERVTPRAAAGAIVAVAGVAVLALCR